MLRPQALNEYQWYVQEVYTFSFISFFIHVFLHDEHHFFYALRNFEEIRMLSQEKQYNMIVILNPVPNYVEGSIQDPILTHKKENDDERTFSFFRLVTRKSGSH